MDFSILLDNVRPIGQNFPPEGKCTLLSEKASTSQLYKQIKAYRAKVQSEILKMLGSKATHDESKFICKAGLIAECSTNSPSVLDKRDVLIPLLCDRDVLCSLQYQDYPHTVNTWQNEKHIWRKASTRHCMTMPRWKCAMPIGLSQKPCVKKP